MAMFNPLIPEKLLRIFWKIRILGSENLQERLMWHLPLFSDWFQEMQQSLLKWLFVSPPFLEELRPHGFVFRWHGVLKKRKEKLTYLISQQNTARQKFRLMLNHRAVILAALYPREISITGLPHPTPAPAISNPVNHFSPE